MTTKSGISTGAFLRTILLNSEEIKKAVTPIATEDNPEPIPSIFPCVAFDNTLLPYIQYQCVGVDPTYVKQRSDVDKMLYDVTVYSAEFDQGLELAEAIREATSDIRCSDGKLHISGIRVINYANRWAGDSYEHTLRLQVTTNSLNDSIKSNG